MRKTTISGLLILILALSIISGCKSKSDDTQPTTAIVKILSQGTLASGVTIGGIDVTVVLPSGVTVKATPDLTNASVLVTNAGVVAASSVAAGTNASTLATYTAATAGASGKVMVHVANPAGFATGEFVTVNCDIAAGSFPTAADFSLTGFNAVDLNGAAISGLTAGFTADIQ